jgi:hypothetical protein
MKKLLIVLAILLVAGAGAFAQEVSVSGGTWAGFIANFNPAGVTGSMEKAEININGSVSDNTSVSIQLDNNEGYPWDSGVLIDDWRVNSSLLAEMGIDAPVSVDLTFGYFDSYFTNWSMATKSYAPLTGAWVGTASNYVYLGTLPSEALAWEWNIGFGDFGLRYYNTWYFGKMAAAFYGSVAGMVDFIAGYVSDYSAIGSGTLFAEVSASLDLGMASLYIPATVAYDLGGSAFAWSSGVNAGIMDMVTVGVGVSGDTATTAFEYIVPEITATPIDGLSIYANGMVMLGGASPFKSVDIGASYAVGPLTVNPGVVIGIDSAYTTYLVDSGEMFGVTGTGMYVLFGVSF